MLKLTEAQLAALLFDELKACFDQIYHVKLRHFAKRAAKRIVESEKEAK
jgi:hypothetical protein